MNDALTILLLALTSALNPTLLAAVTVMLLLSEPRQTMLAYLLGALLTSIACGLAIVFTLQDSAIVSTTRRALSPAEDLVLGGLLIVAGTALRGERAEARREARRRRKGLREKAPSLPERLLGRGSPRVAFFAGVLLTFPGASYLTALTRLSKLDLSDGWIVVIVLALCVIQQALLEVPIAGFWVDPEGTSRKVVSFRAWLSENGWRMAANGAMALGALLCLRGLVVSISG